MLNGVKRLALCFTETSNQDSHQHFVWCSVTSLRVTTYNRAGLASGYYLEQSIQTVFPCAKPLQYSLVLNNLRSMPGKANE